ncbi:hypothetical protein [Luteolibacter soli]|uniref:Fibronectin type-III domain-containing protein n=1 Tax=Luteolibacter soli TaxID=3135280 RepID=A0ABU9B0E5_9BACT
MKASPIAAFALGMMSLSASEVRWTARGTVSNLTGTVLTGTGVVAGDAVEISMGYDSNTQVVTKSIFPLGDGFAGTAWFYGTPNLEITVKIRNQVWTGQLPTILDTANVMESSCRDYTGGSPDWFRVTLDAARGGTFPSFPQTGSETVRALKLEFRDDTAPATLFNVLTLPTSTTSVCAMTSGTGTVQAGTSAINFSITPSSVQISQPTVPTTISKTATGIRLSWKTVLGKSYRIEGCTNLRCWSSEGEEEGTGSTLTKDFPLSETDTKYFYRVVELDL